MIHGTARCYWTGCRCDPCRQAHTDYERKRYRQRTTKQLQDTKTIKAIIARYMIFELANRTGLGEWTLWAIKTGRTKHIRQSTKERILQVMTEDTPTYLGRCQQQLSSSEFCFRKIFDDSFYEKIDDKLICEPCVEGLLKICSTENEFRDFRGRFASSKATVKSAFTGSLSTFRTRKVK